MQTERCCVVKGLGIRNLKTKATIVVEENEQWFALSNKMH